MPYVYTHAMSRHGVIDFVYDGRTGRLDSDAFKYFNCIVRRGLRAVYTFF